MKFSLYPFFFVLLLTPLSLLGQTKVTGTVVDQETGEPMVGASISILNTNRGTITDTDGRFAIQTSSPVLQISYTGYKTQRVTIDTSLAAVKLDTEIAVATESIMSIYLTATRKDYKIHPAITHLSKREIGLNNDASIAPVLNTVPGVFMHSGALNTNRISIRGIGNRNLFGTAKIKAYMEGIPLTNGSGETSLEDIDLSIIDAITVYKGPSSSIHGAGLGGVINLQVNDDIEEDKNVYTLSSTGGSFGLARNTLNIHRKKQDRSILNLNFNRTHNDGYRENNRYDRYSFTGFGKFKLGEDDETINFFANYTNLNAQIPSSLDSTDFADNPEKAAFIWQRAQGNENNRKIIAGASYISYFGNTGIKQISSVYATTRQSYEVRPFNILRETSIIKGLRSELAYKNYHWFDFMDYFDFHLGGEFFDEDYDWQIYDTDGEGNRLDILSDNGENRNLYNLFSQLKMNFNYSIQATAGLNYNLTRYQRRVFFDLNDTPSSLQAFPAIWSPFFNIGVDLSRWLNKDIHISATASHGFSPPTVEETLLPNGALNTMIVPEKGWNYEFAVKGSTQSLDYRLSVYSMQINDLVVAQRTDFDQFIGINAGKTNHNGLELALEYAIHLSNGKIVPFLNYTYADYTFEEFIDRDNDYSGNQLTGTAPHLLNIGGRYQFNNLYGNFIYRFVDAMPMRDDNSIFSDAYHLLDFKVGYRKEFAQKWAIDFFGGINNVWNEKYASMILINAGSFGGNAPRYFYPGLPINFYVGVSVELSE